MPAGMLLKSDGFASNLSAPDREGTLADFCAAKGIPYHDTRIPVSLDVFTSYALDFQRHFVQNVEARQVVSVDRLRDRFSIALDNGESFFSDFVVCAVGITHYPCMPRELAHLPEELASHSSAHHDLARFAGRDVTVIGAGSSAIDIATLLHEAGANTSLAARGNHLNFAPAPSPRPRSLWQRLRRPSSGMGPGLRSWLYQKVPSLFRFLPGGVRVNIIRTHLGPQAAWVMKDRFEAGVAVNLGAHIERAAEDDSRVRLMFRMADGTRREIVTDHVVAATGYWPDVDRLEFLSDGLRDSLRTHVGIPIVSRRFETSVAGLYFVGPSAVDSFGPLDALHGGSRVRCTPSRGTACPPRARLEPVGLMFRA